jgi:hypothetical protein
MDQIPSSEGLRHCSSRGVFPFGGQEKNQEYLEKDRAGILVQHGNQSAGACRARGEKGRGILQELCGAMGVCSSHIFAQRRIQKTNPGGLGGAVYEENHEAYAYGPHVMLMGPQTQGSSDVNRQHTPSRLSYTRATTTSLDGSTGCASTVSRSPRSLRWRHQFTLCVMQMHQVTERDTRQAMPVS